MDNTQQEHLKWLEKLAKEARNKYDRKVVERDNLINEVTKLGRDVEALERAMNTVQESLGLSKPESKDKSGRFVNMTVKQAAETVMREAGGQMRTVDVVKTLSDGGKELGERAYSVVVTTLLRSDKFEKVSKGVFRLKS